MKVAAGIVLYEADIHRLEKNINAILPQVEYLMLFDNGSSNYNEIVKKFDHFDNVHFIDSKQNMGIAFALNGLTSTAMNLGYDWICLLDQDSICADNLIEEYSKVLHIERLGLITPVIVDMNKHQDHRNVSKSSESYSIIQRSITSGSLLNISLWQKLGPFENAYFIDRVDTDYSKRLLVNGYLQIKCLNTHILHEIGKAEKTVLHFIYKLLPNNHTQAWAFRTNHSPLRIYYRTRNTIWLAKKYRRYFNPLSGYLQVFYDAFRTMIIEKNKAKVIQSIYKGIKDGFKTQIDAYTKIES